MSVRTHVDLFSGIGGFALAAHTHGVQTIAFCEIDTRCRNLLERAWAGVPVHSDVRTFPGEQYRGAWLLTGGVPCQPASRAGKQRGAADDRWLWPAALACLAAVRPTWALFENPPGIGDVGLAGICAEMGALGYEVQPVSLPAAAVGSPQRRERYWILAHRDGTGDVRVEEYGGEQGASRSDTPRRLEGRRWPWEAWDLIECPDGRTRRAPVGGFDVAHGVSAGILPALGNSICWPVAAEIIGAMIQAEA